MSVLGQFLNVGRLSAQSELVHELGCVSYQCSTSADTGDQYLLLLLSEVAKAGDILTITLKNGLACGDVACGAGDSCQTLQLEDMRFTGNTDWRT